jgi:hypothetical protein
MVAVGEPIEGRCHHLLCAGPFAESSRFVSDDAGAFRRLAQQVEQQRTRN